MEFALRQLLRGNVETILAAKTLYSESLSLNLESQGNPGTAPLLEKAWTGSRFQKSFIILGGPEIFFLPFEAEILRHADMEVRGEGKQFSAKYAEDF